MTYSKPEIIELGNAARLIQFEVGKDIQGDSGSMTDQILQDFES
jgi:hypothetical protein